MCATSQARSHDRPCFYAHHQQRNTICKSTASLYSITLNRCAAHVHRMALYVLRPRICGVPRRGAARVLTTRSCCSLPAAPRSAGPQLGPSASDRPPEGTPGRVSLPASHTCRYYGGTAWCTTAHPGHPAKWPGGWQNPPDAAAPLRRPAHGSPGAMPRAGTPSRPRADCCRAPAYTLIPYGTHATSPAISWSYATGQHALVRACQYTDSVLTPWLPQRPCNMHPVPGHRRLVCYVS